LIHSRFITDDVYETVPNIKQAMISEIENMNSDIKVSTLVLVLLTVIYQHLLSTLEQDTPSYHPLTLFSKVTMSTPLFVTISSLLHPHPQYLGWCMWSDKKLAPLCMHAYAMDANGAR